MKKIKEFNKIFYLKTFRRDRQASYYVITALLMELFAPSSVIDYGCGLGWLLYYFGKYYQLEDLVGIEPNPEIQYLDSDTGLKNYTKELIYPLSLTHPIHLEKHFDLAVSFEVVEHIKRKYANICIENICRNTDLVVFSASHPGQGGWDTGHINEQPKDYWIEKFNKNNFEMNHENTDRLCYSMKRYGCKPWYWENTMVFDRVKK